MIDHPPLDVSALVLRLINASNEIKLAADYWDDSAVCGAQLNLAFSACNSLYVIAQCLLSMTGQPDNPEDV